MLIVLTHLWDKCSFYVTSLVTRHCMGQKGSHKYFLLKATSSHMYAYITLSVFSIQTHFVMFLCSARIITILLPYKGTIVKPCVSLQTTVRSYKLCFKGPTVRGILKIFKCTNHQWTPEHAYKKSVAHVRYEGTNKHRHKVFYRIEESSLLCSWVVYSL